MKSFVPPFSEVNLLPSAATFERSDTGVRSEMSSQSQKEPTYNGLTIEDLKTFAPMEKHDQLDRVGIASRLLSENVGKYKQSNFHKAYSEMLRNSRSKK